MHSGLCDQLQTAGLSIWVPWHAGGIRRLEPYPFRSTIQAGIVLYDDLRADDFPRELATAALAELHRIRPYFSGKFY